MSNSLNEAIPAKDVVFLPEQTLARRRRFRIYTRILIAIPVICMIAVSAFVISVLNDIPGLAAIENPDSDLSTLVYSADGELLRSFYDEKNRISVQLEDISPHVLNALIATEDIRFYQHSGIDLRGLFAAAWDVAKGNPRGASTITMQLARNLYNQVGFEDSFIRKLKEMIVAVALERLFTKEEILTYYLNTVSFVGNTYGIQNGAQVYFGKNASELATEEAAMLVGVLKATNTYNPHKHPEEAKTRRNIVLNQMLSYEFISQKEFDSLSVMPVVVKERQKDEHNLTLAPYFTEHLRMFLKDWCAERGLDLYSSGLRVYTTVDARMQRHAEAAMQEHLSELQKIFFKHISGREPWLKDSTFLPTLMRRSARYASHMREGKSHDEIEKIFHQPVEMKLFGWDTIRDTTMSPWDSLTWYSKFLETGFMAMDPSNGHIRAWVGGIDHRFFQFDHVYTGKRQVGSTFKPIIYAAAFENGGKTPCDVELNQPVFFSKALDGSDWVPRNADGKVGGFMTLRQGLATSTNLITARLMKYIGPPTVCEFAKQIGITSQLDCVPSLCLGTTDLSVFELTGAYSTFANNGFYNDPVYITRIEDRNGMVLYEHRPTPREAMKPETAYMMLDILMGVVRERGGTGGRLRYRYNLMNDIGGKTGTTQKQSDGWFMGVTPYLVAGTWVGCADRTMRFRSLEYGQGASMALPIFALFMKKVYADSTIGLPKDHFDKPRGFEVELDCRKFAEVHNLNHPDDSLLRNTRSIMNPGDEY